MQDYARSKVPRENRVFIEDYVVVKISGHERKTGKGGQIGDVRHSHMYEGNVDREVKGEEDPTL